MITENHRGSSVCQSEEPSVVPKSHAVLLAEDQMSVLLQEPLWLQS